MPEGPPPAPAVQRLRLRYTKRGRLRFTSHRDFQRALERALRRAGVPMAYSAGFSPHPKISYAGAAPTGAASEAEYVELAVTRRCEPDELRAALDAALPVGLDVVELVEARPGALADLLQASVWRIDLDGVDAATAREAVAAFLAAERVEVTRGMKTGPRTFDARGAVVSLEVLDPAAHLGTDPAGTPSGRGEGNLMGGVAQVDPGVCAILQMVVRHTTPAVRPDDVLVGLRSQAHLAPPSPPRMTRLAQGLLDEGTGTVVDPLATGPNVVGA